jgi:hypothetical protein
VDPFSRLAQAFNDAAVRYVVIGVWGVNYYAQSAHTVFTTRDRDLFLPLEARNLVACWSACETIGLHLSSSGEPLDSPRDLWLAERVIDRRTLVTATDHHGFDVDLTLVMAGCEFENVWQERRVFVTEGAEVPVARLLHIVTSKHTAGRDKDRLFLATHREALEEMLSRTEPPAE